MDHFDRLNAMERGATPETSGIEKKIKDQPPIADTTLDYQQLIQMYRDMGTAPGHVVCPDRFLNERFIDDFNRSWPRVLLLARLPLVDRELLEKESVFLHVRSWVLWQYLISEAPAQPPRTFSSERCAAALRDRMVFLRYHAKKHASKALKLAAYCSAQVKILQNAYSDFMRKNPEFSFALKWWLGYAAGFVVFMSILSIFITLSSWFWRWKAKKKPNTVQKPQTISSIQDAKKVTGGVKVKTVEFPGTDGSTEKVRRFNTVHPQSMVRENRTMSKIDKLRKAAKDKVPHKPQLDSNGRQSAKSLMAHNTYTIWDNGHMIGHALFIKRHYFITPVHYSKYFSMEDIESTKNTMLTFKPVLKPDSTGFQVPLNDLRTCISLDNVEGHTDVGLYRVSTRQCPTHADIESTVTGREYLSKANGVLNIFSPIFADGILEVDLCKALRVADYPIEDGDMRYSIGTGYLYTARRDDGYCGTPIVVADSQCGQKLLGIHIAGAPKEQLSLVGLIDRQALRNALLKYYEIDGPAVAPAPPSAPIPKEMHAQFRAKDVIGVVPMSKMYPLPVKTDIRDSCFNTDEARWAKPLTGPAILHPFVTKDWEVVDPYAKLHQPYDIFPSAILPDDEERLRYCAHDAVFDCMRVIPIDERAHIPLRLLTWEECVKGIPGQISSIPFGTSPGYPFVLDMKIGGKKDILGPNSNLFNIDGPQWRTFHDEHLVPALQSYSKGEIPEVILMDVCKDERRKWARVEAGETRGIFPANLVQYLIMRRYFGAFVCLFTKGRIRNESAVGINVYSMESHIMIQQLLDKNTVGFDGDIKNCDSTFPPCVMRYLCEAINKLYDDGPENCLVRTTLVEQMCNSTHLEHQYDIEKIKTDVEAWKVRMTNAGRIPTPKDVPLAILTQKKPYGILVRWRTGDPSGIFLTSLFTTLYLKTAFRYVYVKRVDPDLSHFKSCVALQALGDDNRWTVVPAIAHQFTPKAVAEEFASLGVIYTAADKTPCGTEFRPVHQLSFLKRTARFEPTIGMWVAPIDMSVIIDMALYSKKGDINHQISISNWRSAIGELSLHSDEVWAEWAPKFFKGYQVALKVPPVEAAQTRLAVLRWARSWQASQ
jgi:hypothetical protein